MSVIKTLIVTVLTDELMAAIFGVDVEEVNRIHTIDLSTYYPLVLGMTHFPPPDNFVNPAAAAAHEAFEDAVTAMTLWAVGTLVLRAARHNLFKDETNPAFGLIDDDMIDKVRDEMDELTSIMEMITHALSNPRTEREVESFSKFTTYVQTQVVIHREKLFNISNNYATKYADAQQR